MSLHPPASDVSDPGTSDLTPSIPECEIFYEGGPDANQHTNACLKNPGHPTFIPVDDVTMAHLPHDFRSERVLSNIRLFRDRTVKITVSYTSLHRPDKYPFINCPYPYSQFKGNDSVGRCGTGFVEYGGHSVTKGKPCPCPICNKPGNEPKMEFLEVKVQTAAHVVFDDTEAERTVCELFYDSKDKMDKVKYLYGLSGGVGKGGGARFGAGGFVPNTGGGGGGGGVTERGRGMVNGTMNGGGGGGCVNVKVKDHFEKCTRDKFTIKCVTHEKELFDRLLVMYNRHEIGRTPTMIISHPHGFSKRITFGKILNHTSPLPIKHDPYSSEYPVGPDVTFRIAQNPTTVAKADSNSPCESESLLLLDRATENSTVAIPTKTAAIQSDPNLPDPNVLSSHHQHPPSTHLTHPSTPENQSTHLQQPQHQEQQHISKLQKDFTMNTTISLSSSQTHPNKPLTLTNFEFEHQPQNPITTPASLSSIPDLIRFQKLLNSGNLCKPEVDYSINEPMTLRLPLDATYFCQCKPYDGGYNPCSEVVQFPSGTTFTLGDSKIWQPLPEGVEFNLESDHERFGLRRLPYHVVYNMDTCPGCSGALILDENYLDFRLSWLHAGAVPGEASKDNKSGCYFSVYSMGWC